MKIPKSNLAEENENVCPAWIPIQDTEGKPLRPIIRCKCGELCGIGWHHIHKDGRVTASFYHHAPAINNPCGFHVYIELENWTGEEYLPEPKK